MMNDYSANLLHGNTDMLILGLIDELDSAHGYQLIKEMERRSNGFFRLKEGTLYPLLRKLENEGLLEGKWKAASNGPEKRCYLITPKGKEILDYRKASWRDFAKAINMVFQTDAV
ncbi:MAG: PadR family transcriptional regulator [Dehalococcoidales bacterium]|jgi:PadR family transcriptional regulator PadR|nr:PadR family transcriptional regulator [Dehalococcoidales bacterium]MDD3265504.1 PadR family transcriptional regulator [Dehalococcoidales bacterium]MDD4794004.1 PadR family transcriptional regulator [Dehalococcoidales bacterium]MDD5499206.1 PadR family transcriptional regulator [Dehalococcoidales bacterium]MDX9802785.1 PadR family transcriptional regulator [Dehalococcoidales bacterium]